MANFTKTISNSIKTQGPGVPNLWGVMVWGTDYWGNTKDTRVAIGKYISDSILVSTALSKSSTHQISNAMTFSSSLNMVYLLDGSGYTHVLQGGVTDPNNRYYPSYTADTQNTPSYTTDTQPTISWSQA